jgi:hypothetical protein
MIWNYRVMRLDDGNNATDEDRTTFKTGIGP